MDIKTFFSRKIIVPFWNRGEHRLRTLWRFSALALVFFLIVLILQLAALPFGDMKGAKTGEMLANFGIIAAIWIAARFIDRRRFSDTGVYFKRSWWTDLGFGLLLGIALMTTIFLVELGLGWITVSDTFRAGPDQSFLIAILITALFFITVGIAEELMFRGYLLLNLAEGINSRWITPKAALIISWIFASGIFGFGHLGNPNATMVSTLNIGLAGIFLGFAYVLTGSLAVPIGLHISWNFFQGNVFGFPVSGTTDWSTTFLVVEQRGPEFWTGGAFGPEGGFMGLLGILLGMAITALWIRFRYSKLTFYTQIANPPEGNIVKEPEVYEPPDDAVRNEFMENEENN